jgi:hypothetical protein
MTLERVEYFLGKPVRDFDVAEGLVQGIAPRLRAGGDEGSLPDLLQRYLAQPGARETEALVIGAPYGLEGTPDPSAAIVSALAEGAYRLPALRGLFLGDVSTEECPLETMRAADLWRLPTCYPKLEVLRARGGAGLGFGMLRHEALRALVVESAGIEDAVVRQIAAATLPALEHLELWLGREEHGGSCSVDDLGPILLGEGFPRLTYLGLRYAGIADYLAPAAANAPILDHVRVLDLSYGDLTDVGGRALARGPGTPGLAQLDIRGAALSPDVVAELQGLGISVVLA